MECIPDIVIEAKNLRLARSWSLGGNPTTINLINEHSNKTTCNSMLLYLQISEFLKFPLRSFL